jgi:hypothetical protein
VRLEKITKRRVSVFVTPNEFYYDDKIEQDERLGACGTCVCVCVCVCAGGVRNASGLSGCNNNENKLFGRHKHKWEDIIKMDIM